MKLGMDAREFVGGAVIGMVLTLGVLLMVLLTG